MASANSRVTSSRALLRLGATGLDAVPAEVAELELGSAKQRDQRPNRQSDDIEYEPDDHRYDPEDRSYHDSGVPRIVAVDSIVGGE
jgi:hypothetical protein